MVLAAGTSRSGVGVRLDRESLARLVIWMETYGRRQGFFSAEQEAYLAGLRRSRADMLTGLGPE